MTEHLIVTRDRGVLVARLNRPEKKNALTAAMYEGLARAFAEADRDEAVGAIVIAGSNGVFTAGNDIGDFLATGARPGRTPAFDFIRLLPQLATPLVAAVEGVAVGVGTTLTLHCDLVYAAPTARFRMPFVDLGLVPEAGSSYLLPRRVGIAKASELLLLGDGYDAAEAHRLGLVNAVVPAEALLDHAVAQARRLAQKPRAAIAATRRLIRGDTADILSAQDRESEAFSAALQSPAAKAAFEAFLSKAKTAAS